MNLTWGPRLAPVEALRLYGLQRDDLLLLAMADCLRVDGGFIRLAATDGQQVRELLDGARSADRLRAPDTTLERE